MTMMRTSNPALNDNVFRDASRAGLAQAMTIEGTVNKTFLLLFLVFLSASMVWTKVMQSSLGSAGLLILIGSLGGFVAGLVTIFKKEWAAVTAPLYAILEGLLLGGLSAHFELQFPGIVIQTVSLTFAALFCLLTAYKSGLIKVTENFKLGVAAATGAICLIYFADLILGFFRIHIPMIYSYGIAGIIFSVFVVGIAALNLVLDFDFIEHGAAMGAPKYMEWYGAFGLIVTLIWLYLEILRLLSKLRSRR